VNVEVCPEMSNTEKFNGQRALITGGTKGIGKATALRLAGRGAHVYLNYASSQADAEETLAELQALGHSAELLKADIGDPEQVATLLKKVHADGPLDMLICNAAYSTKVPFVETEFSLLQRSLEVNVLGNFNLIQQASRVMSEAGVNGRIVICSSPHGTFVFPDAFAYDVSKAALNHLMRGVALPLIDDGIRVNAVDIGWTLTPGERAFTTEAEQHEISQTIIPIKRSAEADEIAGVIEFLCSDESSYIVGSLVGADGGFALRPSTQV
jgi:glucose 1-dehydrogenase